VRLQQLFLPLLGKPSRAVAAHRLTEVFSRDCIGEHRFNERALARYFDDAIERCFGTGVEFGTRFLLMTLAFAARAARQPVLAVNLRGEGFLSTLLQQAGIPPPGQSGSEGNFLASRKGVLEACPEGLPASCADADTVLVDCSGLGPAQQQSVLDAVSGVGDTGQSEILLFSFLRDGTGGTGPVNTAAAGLQRWQVAFPAAAGREALTVTLLRA
jgi:hypothetical protein